MRIAWFTHRYHPVIGGSENFGRAMARRFVAAGHAVDVITSDAHDLAYFTDPAARRVDAGAATTVDGARVFREPVTHFPLQRYVGRLLSYAPHWPTRCCRDSFMPWIGGLDRPRGPYDAVFAVGFPFTAFPYAAYRTARACGATLAMIPFLHLATPGDPVRKVYTREHQRRLLAEADLVVAATPTEANYLASRGIDRAKILVLPMAVEHAEVAGGDRATLRGRLGIPAAGIAVGQLGALDPNKGTDHLVLALAELNADRARLGHEPIHLILAGSATPRFEAFAATLSGESSRWLHRVGPLPEGCVADYYAALDVFAMPSRTDSFGIVFLEAWANALPVVAAAAGGVVDVVEHGRTGLLVPFGDHASLTRAVGSLVSDPALARRLGEAGRDRVARGFTWDDRSSTLWARTHALLADRPRPHRRAGRAVGRGRV